MLVFYVALSVAGVVLVYKYFRLRNDTTNG